LGLPGLAGCRAQQPWPLWESYTTRFVDAQGRVIDHSEQDRTTSEGQAYALFFALVDNDRAHFDKLLHWTEDNLAGGDLTLHLPAWEWGHSVAGEWKVLDANPASDADLWLAYTLMEAGRLWHEPRFDRLGHLLAQRIAREEVVLIPGLGTTLAPGPNGFHPDAQHWVLNPSYLPLPVLTRLTKAEPQGPWGAVLESLPQVLDGATTGGFAMDFEMAGPDGVRPAPPPPQATSGDRVRQAAGGYDAIRVYLWLGLADPATPGVHEALGSLGGMATYLKTQAVPPLEVDATGKVMRADAPVGFSAAVIPYLLANGMKAQAQTQGDRLTALRDPATGLYGRNPLYYDQNLALFSTGFLERRYRFERDGRLHVAWK
jgi:endoglucanase